MIAELYSAMDFSWALNPAGIYFLLLKGEVQYVGKSINVPLRIAQHRNNLRRHRRGLPRRMGDDAIVVNFDAVRVILCDRNSLDAQEISWIQRLNPPCNTKLNRGIKYELKHHGFFTDLLAIGAARQKAESAVQLRSVPSLQPGPKRHKSTTLLRGRSSAHV